MSIIRKQPRHRQFSLAVKNGYIAASFRSWASSSRLYPTPCVSIFYLSIGGQLPRRCIDTRLEDNVSVYSVDAWPFFLTLSDGSRLMSVFPGRVADFPTPVIYGVASGNTREASLGYIENVKLRGCESWVICREGMCVIGHSGHFFFFLALRAVSVLSVLSFFFWAMWIAVYSSWKIIYKIFIKNIL